MRPRNEPVQLLLGWDSRPAGPSYPQSQRTLTHPFSYVELRNWDPQRVPTLPLGPARGRTCAGSITEGHRPGLTTATGLPLTTSVCLETLGCVSGAAPAPPRLHQATPRGRDISLSLPSLQTRGQRGSVLRSVCQSDHPTDRLCPNQTPLSVYRKGYSRGWLMSVGSLSSLSASLLARGARPAEEGRLLALLSLLHRSTIGSK